MDNQTQIELLPASYDHSCWSVNESGTHVAEQIRELTAANQKLNSELVLCRKQQDELRQSLVASIDADKSATALHRNLGHALRTPLNAIIGFSDVISNEIHGPAGYAKYIEYAKHINQAGLHLLQLIDDLLDATRLETGEIELSKDIIDLEDCITRSLEALERQAAERRVFLVREIAGNLPLMYGDHTRMKQIFVNLIGNAVKFTPAGGSVLISVLVLSDGAMRVMITDTGIGIAPCEMAKICEMYRYPANRSASSPLGLPLAKALTERHGGILEIASESGRGTTITVIFPASVRVTQQGFSYAQEKNIT